MVEKINYLEIPTQNIAQSKAFFADVFGWTFTDYGQKYSAFFAKNAGIDGGFFRSSRVANTQNGSVLVVFYSEDLDAIAKKISQTSGKITKPTFTFPGGRRFHFSDPSGNEFAIWSKTLA